MKKNKLTICLPIQRRVSNKIPIKIALLLLFITNVEIVTGQDVSQLRRNTIKLDLTSNLLFRNAFNLSYERVRRPDQTYAITLGYHEFPKLTSLGNSIQTTDDSKKQNGFKVGGEYRFYLKKENKYQAPHGVYIGPYASYLNFNNERDLRITADDGTVYNTFFKSNINVLNIGFQAGYQFVINDRFSIDLAFIGPSISRYSAKFNLDGDFDIDDEYEYQNEILKALVDRFPLLDELIKDKEVDRNGKMDTWSFGYRYQVLVGYRFGRKK
ncbi:MAG TPA: DUF3575 domain-containing protein [Chryseolinea sp.]|nr:DUF3575 domain-containing protein [Chryseolinea sp.]